MKNTKTRRSFNGLKLKYTTRVFATSDSPLSVLFISSSVFKKFESCTNEGAKNPCLRIADSLCSPHDCKGKYTFKNANRILKPKVKEKTKHNRREKNYVEKEHKQTSQCTATSRLAMVQLVQNHFTISLSFCNGSQSLSSSSSSSPSSNMSTLLPISWKLISLCFLVFF